MQSFASIVILTYAGILVVGGIIGWKVSGSRISLTSSLASAAVLSFAYYLSYSSPRSGYALAALVAMALEAVFAIRLGKTKKFMPSGMMLVVSSVAVVLLAWSTIRAW